MAIKCTSRNVTDNHLEVIRTPLQSVVTWLSHQPITARHSLGGGASFSAQWQGLFGIAGQVGRHLKASVSDELSVRLKNRFFLRKFYSRSRH